MTIPIVRQRAKAPKTRTGCRTCRQRHIKCDEERPACQRCNRSNRDCPGYDPIAPTKSRGAPGSYAVVRPKSTSPTSSSSSSSTSSLASLLYQSPREITVDLNAMEFQLLDFFRLQTVHQLPGNSWAMSWERLALHSGSHEPAVSHAAIALSSLHRGQQDLALDQCNKAMASVRSRIESLALGELTSDSDVEVITLVALLLFCFEIWRAQDWSAVMHLSTGQNILYDRVRSRNGETGDDKRIVKVPVTPKSNLDVLLQTFVRLGSDLLITRGSDKFLRSVVKERIPNCFSSLEEALVHLDSLSSLVDDASRDLVNAAKDFLDTSPEVRQKCIPQTLRQHIHKGMQDCLRSTFARSVNLDGHPELQAKLPVLKQDICHWMSALAGLPVVPEHEAAHLLIQMQAFTLWYEVCTWREPDEMYSDGFEEQFEHILTQAERYVSLQANSKSDFLSPADDPLADTIRPGFSLGTNLVPCIVITALKCRRSVIRRRCVDWMRRIDLKGVFDTDFIVAMTQKVIDLEESRARKLLGLGNEVDLECHQVPLEARILELDVAARITEDSMQAESFHDADKWMHMKTEMLRKEAYSFYKRDTGRVVFACYGADGDIEIREEDFPIARRDGKTFCREMHYSTDCIDPALLEGMTV